MATLLGVVNVPLEFLDFTAPRQVDIKIHQRLTRMLKKKKSISILSTVDQTKVQHIYKKLNLSNDQLRRTLNQRPASLPTLTGIRLQCLYGQYISTATSRNGAALIPVWLFSAESTGPLLHIIESYSHESGYSDGEIYQKIYETRGRNRDEFEWWITTLSRPKERIMRMLLRPKNARVVAALDKLLVITGLIGGLQLGNFHRYLALHCDEQIVCYLFHVYMIWETICDGDKAVMSKIDLESIRILQFRMPTVSPRDAAMIKWMFSEGTVFPAVMDLGIRRRLKRKLLSLDIVIPSLETFQENMKYFAIGARILMRHIVDDLPVCKSGKKRSPTLYETASNHWIAPQFAQVQVDDLNMKTIEGSPTLSLAWQQLFLAALRLFPYLQGADPPREDKPADNIQPCPQPDCVSYLQGLASELGFQTEKITRRQDRYAVPNIEDEWEEMPDWRGGRPFTRVFWTLRAHAFLPTLMTLRRRQPNPEFVLLDMMEAFFGKFKTPLEAQLPKEIVEDDTRRADELMKDQGPLDIEVLEDEEMSSEAEGGDREVLEDEEMLSEAEDETMRDTDPSTVDSEKLKPRSKNLQKNRGTGKVTGRIKKADSGKPGSTTLKALQRAIPIREAPRSIFGPIPQTVELQAQLQEEAQSRAQRELQEQEAQRQAELETAQAHQEARRQRELQEQEAQRQQAIQEQEAQRQQVIQEQEAQQQAELQAEQARQHFQQAQASTEVPDLSVPAGTQPQAQIQPKDVPTKSVTSNLSPVPDATSLNFERLAARSVFLPNHAPPPKVREKPSMLDIQAASSLDFSYRAAMSSQATRMAPSSATDSVTIPSAPPPSQAVFNAVVARPIAPIRGMRLRKNPVFEAAQQKTQRPLDSQTETYFELVPRLKSSKAFGRKHWETGSSDIEIREQEPVERTQKRHKAREESSDALSVFDPAFIEHNQPTAVPSQSVEHYPFPSPDAVFSAESQRFPAIEEEEEEEIL